MWECVVTSSGLESRGTVLFIGSIKSRPHAGTSRVARMTFIMVKVARTMSLCFKTDRMVFYVTEDVLQMYNIYIWEKRREKKSKEEIDLSRRSYCFSFTLLYFFSSFFFSLSFFFSFVNDNVKNTIQITHILCPNPKLFTYDVLTLKQKRLYIYIYIL